MGRIEIGVIAFLCWGMIFASPADLAAQPVPAGFESVDIPVTGERAATIKAYLRKPASNQAVPAVVALHGCGGLFRRDGRLAARDADWAERLAELGYAVMFPDSFNPRGFREICTSTGDVRPIRPRHRVADAIAATSWLARQPFIDGNRIALIGWSNGGTTVLMAADKPQLAKSAVGL